jgi:hypothetical protein
MAQPDRRGDEENIGVQHRRANVRPVVAIPHIDLSPGEHIEIDDPDAAERRTLSDEPSSADNVSAELGDGDGLSVQTSARTLSVRVPIT